MKKEIIVGCFLILMLIVSFVNIHFLNKLTDNVIQFIEEKRGGGGETVVGQRNLYTFGTSACGD